MGAAPPRRRKGKPAGIDRREAHIKGLGREWKLLGRSAAIADQPDIGEGSAVFFESQRGLDALRIQFEWDLNRDGIAGEQAPDVGQAFCCTPRICSWMASGPGRNRPTPLRPRWEIRCSLPERLAPKGARLLKDHRHPEIDLAAVAASGNVYRHEYEAVDESLIRHTVRHDLAALRRVAEREFLAFRSDLGCV